MERFLCPLGAMSQALSYSNAIDLKVAAFGRIMSVKVRILLEDTATAALYCMVVRRGATNFACLMLLAHRSLAHSEVNLQRPRHGNATTHKWRVSTEALGLLVPRTYGTAHRILGRHYHESAADDRPCGSLTPNQNHYWTNARLSDTSDHRAAKKSALLAHQRRGNHHRIDSCAHWTTHCDNRENTR